MEAGGPGNGRERQSRARSISKLIVRPSIRPMHRFRAERCARVYLRFALASCWKHAGARVIGSFRDTDTAQIFRGQRVRGLPDAIQARARRKLRMLNAAHRLDDLRSPPGNRLEKLSGARSGAYSIRINDQWRICFRWDDRPYDVEIVDYH
jgi:proteic killer suppression protein